MKLYDGGRAPNPRRVRVFLAEKGVGVPLEPIDIAAREHRGPDYLALNPAGRIPALVLDDGTVIAESVAICRYFEELHPEPALFGRGPVQRALVEMWQRQVEFDLLAPAAAAFRHAHPAMAELEVPQVPDYAAASRAKVPGMLRRLDAQLADPTFLCGDDLSIADITGLVALDFLRLPRIAIPDDLVHLRRWHAALSARPSAGA